MPVGKPSVPSLPKVVAYLARLDPDFWGEVRIKFQAGTPQW